MRGSITVLAVVLLCAGCGTVDSRQRLGTAARTIRIGPSGPTDVSGDCARIQRSLDRAQGRPAIVQFAPGDYVLADPDGIRVPPHTTLLMDGARFILDESINRDGQAFLLDGVSDVSLRGGEIAGSRDAWNPGTNVAGIRVTGNSRNIHISDLTCRNLSSNAVGVFGTGDEAPIRNVALVHVTGINCCNTYIDYLQPNKGPVPGSDRRDQGTAALYHVDGWTVDACRFEGSQSDGTHFFRCRNGSFSGSAVTGSRMGGYFLEGCERVTATGNVIRDNGSRGATIERDSRFCILSGNVITGSGREGLWAPDVEAILVSGNVFEENGRKDDGEKDCEIRLDDTAEFSAVTRDIRIEDNIFRTAAHQTAAVLFGPGVAAMALDNNTFTGPAPRSASAAGTP